MVKALPMKNRFTPPVPSYVNVTGVPLAPVSGSIILYPTLLKGINPSAAPHFLVTTGKASAKYEKVASDFFCDKLDVDILVNEADAPISNEVSNSDEYETGLVTFILKLGRMAIPVPPMPMFLIKPLKGISPNP